MDALFMAGTVSDSSRLGGGKLKAWDGNITIWQELQGILDDVQGETTIRMTQDLSAVQGVDPKLELVVHGMTMPFLSGLQDQRNSCLAAYLIITCRTHIRKQMFYTFITVYPT